MAGRAVELLNGVYFDERQIRVDWDSGEGRKRNRSVRFFGLSRCSKSQSPIDNLV